MLVCCGYCSIHGCNAMAVEKEGMRGYLTEDGREDIPCDQWQNIFRVVGDQISLSLMQRCEVCCTTWAAQGYLGQHWCIGRGSFALQFML